MAVPVMIAKPRLGEPELHHARGRDRQLRDLSNTNSDLKRTLEGVGYGNITSHTFRRTVATLMDAARLSARAAADQLGHAQVSTTTHHYFGRRISATGAARVLEAVADPTSRASRGEQESHG